MDLILLHYIQPSPVWQKTVFSQEQQLSVYSIWWVQMVLKHFTEIQWWFLLSDKRAIKWRKRKVQTWLPVLVSRKCTNLEVTPLWRRRDQVPLSPGDCQSYSWIQYHSCYCGGFLHWICPKFSHCARWLRNNHYKTRWYLLVIQNIVSKVRPERSNKTFKHLLEVEQPISLRPKETEFHSGHCGKH